MRYIDLLNEAEFRGLEVDSQEKSYLVEVLLIDDKAYAELMAKLGSHQEAIEFAQGEFAHYNQELRRQRTVTKVQELEDSQKHRNPSYSSELPTPLTAGDNSDEKQPKGKKRVRPTEKDEEMIFEKKKKGFLHLKTPSRMTRL